MQRLRRHKVRRFFSGLATAALLAHAVLITLHTTAVVARTFDTAQETLLSAIAVSICGPGRTFTSDLAESEAANSSQHNTTPLEGSAAIGAGDCPICAGHAGPLPPLSADASLALSWPRSAFLVPVDQERFDPAGSTLWRGRDPPLSD